MRTKRPWFPAALAAVLASISLVSGALAQGQVTPARRLGVVSSQPAAAAQPAAAQPVAAPAAPLPAASASSEFSPEEVQRLTATYNALTPDEQAEMIAYYADMGVDLLVALGLKPGQVVMALPLPDAVRMLSFARQPAAVLAARSKLGFGDGEMPETSDTAALAEWLHTRVLAGEWSALAELFAKIPAHEATDIYSHILRSTNEGGGGLLPEEVLTLGDACPGEIADWQLDVLAQLLKSAASRYGAGPF
ncbi:MAG: hypothetical protein ACF8R7_07570, partial [Phycisphaerales bacterium JB039]